MEQCSLPTTFIVPKRKNDITCSHEMRMLTEGVEIDVYVTMWLRLYMFILYHIYTYFFFCVFWTLRHNKEKLKKKTTYNNLILMSKLG